MLHSTTYTHGSYAFRFQEKVIDHIVQLWSVGWDEQTSRLYKWSGRSRKEKDMYVFQYTVSGYGLMNIGERTIKLEPGLAFLVSIDGDYEYYLPEESDKWEFIFITLYGREVKNCWTKLHQKFGHVIRFHPESAPIQLLLYIYTQAAEKKIEHAFQASALAYQFMMELYHYCSHIEQSMNDWPEPIIKAALYAKHHYARAITQEHMAEAAQCSRYHFTRLFKKTTGQTPIQYLTQIRIEKAAELLHNTKYRVDEIASKVGFSSGNYFSKVFKSWTGLSPGQFRRRKHTGATADTFTR